MAGLIHVVTCHRLLLLLQFSIRRRVRSATVDRRPDLGRARVPVDWRRTGGGRGISVRVLSADGRGKGRGGEAAGAAGAATGEFNRLRRSAGSNCLGGHQSRQMGRERLRIPKQLHEGQTRNEDILTSEPKGNVSDNTNAIFASGLKCQIPLDHPVLLLPSQSSVYCLNFPSDGLGS